MHFHTSYIFRLSLWGLPLMGTAVSVSAQKQITHQDLYFFRYYGQYRINPHWGATLEVEDRRFFDGNRNLNWTLPRVALIRSLGAGWSAAAGFTYYLSLNPADPDSPIAVSVPELRPHEELAYKQDLGSFVVSHRYRLEERFIRRTRDNRLASGYGFNFRMRYQLQLAYALIGKSGPGSLQVKLADEVMFNLGNRIVRNTFDQNRLYLGLNYGISQNFHAELGYLKWVQERSSGDQYYNRDIARFTLYHSLSFHHRKS